MKKKTYTEKLVSLLNMKNSMDFSNGSNMSIQVAIQSKLVQVAKKILGMYSEELGYFDVTASTGKNRMFKKCSLSKSLCDCEEAVKHGRLDYVQFWAPESIDAIYYSGIFPCDTVEDFLFLSGGWVLEMDGTCIMDLQVLEETILELIRELDLFTEEDEYECAKRLAFLTRQMHFYFSGKIGPVISEVAEYIESLYYFLYELVPREDIAKQHDVFSLIYAYGSDDYVSVVSSPVTMKYIKYRDRIPDSDIRKQIADRAVQIFLHPISSDKENSVLASWDMVIEKADRHIVICYYNEEDRSGDNMQDKLTNPFYVDAVQIIDTLLPELESEFSET